MKPMKNKKIFAAIIFTKDTCTPNLNYNRSDVKGQQELCPSLCKFPMLMHFVPILRKRYSQNIFYMFLITTKLA